MEHLFYKMTLLGVGLLSGLSTQAQFFPAYEINPAFISSKATTNPGQWETGIFRGNLIWGDCNNDDLLDLFAIGNTTAESWHANMFGWKNTGNGHFELLSGLPFLYRSDPSKLDMRGTNGAVFAWIDYNNDGNLDMLEMGIKEGFDEKSTNPDELFLNLYKGNGNGTFTLVENTGLRGLTIEQESAYQSTIAVADINRDGYNDIAVIGALNKDRVLDIYKNNGDGTFTLLTETNADGGTLSGINSGTIAWGDYDKDGYPDLLINGWISAIGPSVYICHNEKNNKFKIMDMSFDDGTAGLPAMIGSQKGGVAWSDLNNNGWLDAFISGETYKDNKWGRTADLLINRTNDCTLPSFALYPELQFEHIATVESGISAQQKNAIDLADVNNDGFMDIIMAGESGGAELRFCLGQGNNKFKEDNSYVDAGFRSGSAFKLADYDNDGYLDFAGMGYVDGRGPVLGIYHHKGTYYNDKLEEMAMPKNTQPTTPTEVKMTSQDGKLQVSWKAATDQETPQQSLRYNLCVEKVNGETFMLVPANRATGKLKTSDCDQAILETQLALNIPYNEVKKCAVQTIDQGKLASAFTEATATALSETTVEPLSIMRQGNQLLLKPAIKAALTIYDVCGRAVFTSTDENGQFTLPTLNGSYIVVISTLQGRLCEKIIF